jgi:hypothetical protein
MYNIIIIVVVTVTALLPGYGILDPIIVYLFFLFIKFVSHACIAHAAITYFIQ